MNDTNTNPSLTTGKSPGGKSGKLSRAATLLIVLVAVVGGALIGQTVEPTWEIQENSIDVRQDDAGLYYTSRGKRTAVDEAYDSGGLFALEASDRDGKIRIDDQGNYFKVTAIPHYGIWSLLPAFVAIGLCLATREPLISLLAGVICGALILGQWDITDSVLAPSFASDSAAKVLLLYLILLGGLMGIWSRTGAAQAFAQWATRKFVRGPKTAKLVAWGLGVLFFQGGTVSTVLVGTCVRPIADQEKVSHEELSYVVDSTASPIAILLAFNAWPAYVVGLIFVPGVAVLATDELRSQFFFNSLWLSFYAIFAVLGTFLLAIDKAPILGKQMRAAIKRSRETGELDRPGSEPMTSKELETSHVPEGYRPSVWEFGLPLIILTGVAIGTYAFMGSPMVNWAFGAAVLFAAVSALVRGMSLSNLVEGIGIGLKGVVFAAVILLFAVTLGQVSRDIGGGAFLVASLGDAVPYWLLPAALMVLTMVIAFATGTSWGTYAVAFPLAMPLAWAIAEANQLDNPVLFLMVCFAAVLNGSVYGDQCSPISDTTILSSMTTGADLMDHVKTQIIPASVAAGLAIMCWQVIVLVFV